MTSMTQDFNFFKFFFDVFVFLVTFDLLSHYPKIIHIIQILFQSHWLREDVQWIPDKVFRENLMVQLASTLSSRTIFFAEFWFLPVFVIVFTIIRLIVMSY